MTTDLAICEAVDKAFVAAFLLSGNAELAEAAVLKSIGLMNLEGACGENLLHQALNAVIQPQESPRWRPKHLELAISKLPWELKRVLRLPRYIRQCFVLRVLARWPRELCATLLNSDADQIDRGACAAMLRLPWFQANGSAAYSGWDGSNN
jgi:hypothetical protein